MNGLARVMGDKRLIKFVIGSFITGAITKYGRAFIRVLNNRINNFLEHY